MIVGMLVQLPMRQCHEYVLSFLTIVCLVFKVAVELLVSASNVSSAQKINLVSNQITLWAYANPDVFSVSKRKIAKYSNS